MIVLKISHEFAMVIFFTGNYVFHPMKLAKHA